jgi:apoptosis-inducing factor 2
VQVDDELRVTAGSQSKHGRRDQLIYAVGDITTHPVRMAMKVGEQVPVVVANLKADITGQGKRATYVQNPKMLVPVGASTGTGVAMGWVWSKLVSLMKGRDFFVSKAAGLGVETIADLDLLIYN